MQATTARAIHNTGPSRPLVFSSSFISPPRTVSVLLATRLNEKAPDEMLMPLFVVSVPENVTVDVTGLPIFKL